MDAVRRLKSWRAADPAGMWAELLAAACDSPAYRERFHRLVIAALRDGMPAAAKQSELLPFFKKGDAAAPGNYRGIQLISILRKVVALIVSKDLCRRLEPTLLVPVRVPAAARLRRPAVCATAAGRDVGGVAAADVRGVC
jgi:hypothetical protein